MIGNIFNHGFEMPTGEMELPPWADSFVNTWCELFWDQTWKDEDCAIAALEREMIEARYSYIKEGMVLRAFQYYKWYAQKGFKTFKNYCEKHLKKPYFYAKRTIEAAQVAWGLLLEGFTELPDNVSQAQSLKSSADKVSEEYDETFSCWEKVLETSKAEGKALTANYIEKTITGEENKPMANAKIPRSDWDKLAKKAKKMGKSTQQLLQEIVKDYVGDDEALSPEVENSEPANNNTDSDSENVEQQPWFKEMVTAADKHFQTNENNYDTTSNDSTIP